MKIFTQDTKQVTYNGQVLTVPDVVKYLFLFDDGVLAGTSSEPVLDSVAGMVFWNIEDSYMHIIADYGSHVENWDQSLVEV